MNIFLADISKNIEIGYDELLSDINNSTSYKLYCNSTDYYEIFKTILLSLIHDKEICLLDSDFTKKEITNLLGDCNIHEEIYVSPYYFGSFHEILEHINLSNNWELSLFTSGTTGVPKKITHNFKNLTRNCKIRDRFSSNIWGYAYNPTHMAGLQVFFQALLNLNTIVRLFDIDRSQIFKSIEKYKITNISATPTFYRMLLPSDCLFSSLKRITSGGEKFDGKLNFSLLKLFPNAKFLNVYASTEAGSIFAAEGEEFFIQKQYFDWVKIHEGELFLHKKIIGNGAENKMIGDWYPTGDLIDVISDNPIRFKFLSRKNEMINVGGYKVNPNEVEELLTSYNGIAEARVFGKPNSVLGNIVCAEVVSLKELNILEIRNYLSENLQSFKIPRIINFVDKIEKTRTGKKKR